MTHVGKTIKRIDSAYLRKTQENPRDIFSFNDKNNKKITKD